MYICIMKNDLDTKQKVVRVLYTINKNDNDNGFNYYENLVDNLYSKDPDFNIIKSKLDNLMILLEKKGYDYLSSLDFEKEIWEMI